MPPKNTPTRANPPQKSYKYIAVIFVILAFLLVLGVTYLALSKVNITLVASDDKISHNFELVIAKDPSQNSLTNVIIPGEIFSKDEEAEGTYFVESDQLVDGVAEGRVTLFNDRSVDQSLVATTRLLTSDNILFRLKDKVTVPANGNITADVYADEKGDKGNIGPTTFTIPGLSEDLQKQVYAKSISSMVGGVRKIGTLTESDIEKAELQLKQGEQEKYIAEFANQLQNKNMILIGSQADISEVKHEEEIGQEVDSFGLTAKSTAMAVFADRDQILEMAKNKLKESKGPKADFVSVDPSSLKYELVSVDLEKQEALVKVEISGLMTLDPSKDIFDKNLLVGFTEEDLKLYFSQFDSVKEVQVEFSPFWVKKVPILKDHINIVVE